MSLPVLARLAHVLCAVLGAGSVGALAIVAHRTRAASELPMLRTLLRWATGSMASVLATGALLDVAVGGAFHSQIWYRLSGLLVLATAAALARAVVLSRQAALGRCPHETALRASRAICYAAALTVTWVVVLMELQPFR